MKLDTVIHRVSGQCWGLQGSEVSG